MILFHSLRKLSCILYSNHFSLKTHQKDVFHVYHHLKRIRTHQKKNVFETGKNKNLNLEKLFHNLFLIVILKPLHSLFVLKDRQSSLGFNQQFKWDLLTHRYGCSQLISHLLRLNRLSQTRLEAGILCIILMKRLDQKHLWEVGENPET